MDLSFLADFVAAIDFVPFVLPFCVGLYNYTACFRLIILVFVGFSLMVEQIGIIWEDFMKLGFPDFMIAVILPRSRSNAIDCYVFCCYCCDSSENCKEFYFMRFNFSVLLCNSRDALHVCTLKLI